MLGILSIFSRFDGFDCAAGLLGTFLSPVVYTYLGPYGSLGIYAAFNALSILHLVFFVKEPIVRAEKKEPSEGEKEPFTKRAMSFLKTYVYDPMRSMVRIVVMEREDQLRTMLVFLVACYGINYFMSEERGLMYLWMLKVYDGFGGNDYAVFQVYDK